MSNAPRLLSSQKFLDLFSFIFELNFPDYCVCGPADVLVSDWPVPVNLNESQGAFRPNCGNELRDTNLRVGHGLHCQDPAGITELGLFAMEVGHC